MMDRYCPAPCLRLFSSPNCSSGCCLIAAAVRNDPLAREAMFDKLKACVTSQARVLCRDEADAEDLAQQVLLIALKRIRQLRDARKIAAWTWKIVRNQHRMSLRRGKYAPPELEPFDEFRMPPACPRLPDAFRALAMTDLRVRLLRSFFDLSDTLQSVLELRIVEEQSTSQIAQTLGISEDVVRTRLLRGRQALRRSLE